MELEGAEELAKALKAFQALAGKEIADATVAAGKLVTGDARKSVQALSPGAPVIRFPRGQAPKAHITSRPGDAPNTDSGQLVNGIEMSIKPDGVYVGVGRKGVRDYATYLEFGTRKMRARPFIQPALAGRLNDYRKLLQAALDKVAARGD